MPPERKDTNSWMTLAAGAVSGVVAMLVINKWSHNSGKRNCDKSTGSIREANKAVKFCDPTLFYGEVAKLSKTTENQKFLSKKMYSRMVHDCVVCCVDCLIVRKGKDGRKRVLLVERASEPVKGTWWLPGGRMLKGETFFAAAKRKAQQETGLEDVTPVHVLGVWNTIFPTSSWDTKNQQGTQTVNTMVLVEVEVPSEFWVILDETSANYKWIGLDPIKAAEDGEDIYIQQALARLQEWNPAYDH